MPTGEPALIAAARSQMTASSPRGTFSQPELTADRVITRCITRPMSASGATMVMPADLEPVPTSPFPRCPRCCQAGGTRAGSAP